MNNSKTLKYLLLGTVVGAVLFFAGLGLKSMFTGPDTEAPVVSPTTTSVSASSEGAVEATGSPSVSEGTEAEIPTPEITIEDQQGPIKIKPLDSQNDNEATTNTGLDDDSATEEAPVQFGTLQLNAINAATGKPLKAEFLIQDSDNRAIAKLDDTASGKLSLPEGTYRITVTRDTVSMFRYLGVAGNQNGAETFELEMPEGFVDTNPAAGSALAQAQDASASDPNPQEQVGVLRLSSLSKAGQRPLKSDFMIRRLDGRVVDSVVGVESHQFSLPAGTYTAVARIDEVSVEKKVEVSLDRGLHQIFLIPEEAIATANSNSAAQNESTPNTTNVTSPAGSSDNATAPAGAYEQTQDANGIGRLELFTVRADNQTPLRSNFYIQSAGNNKLIASKTWVESIGYKLPVGRYLVTVRSNGFADQRKIMTVQEGQIRREIFRLK